MNLISEMIPHSQSLDLMFKNEELEKILNHSLFDPVNYFFSSPGKNIRTELVELGYRLSLKKEPKHISDDVRDAIAAAGRIVELIHGGSLIVDDVQDESEIRRDKPTVHLVHGVPLAINAGNWLYFLALSKIKELPLSNRQQSDLIQDIVHLMMKAHTGQAIDIGTKIYHLDQRVIRDTCLASMELKTGTLMTLALRMGAAFSGTDWDKSELSEFGSKLGIMLQMYDDLGNFLKESPKQYEDLYQMRPTWIWAVASELPEDQFIEFSKAIEFLPLEEKLSLWCRKTKFKEQLMNRTETTQSLLLTSFESEWSSTHPESMTKIKSIIQLLEKSYV